jgi:hypothetical protein
VRKRTGLKAKGDGAKHQFFPKKGVELRAFDGIVIAYGVYNFTEHHCIVHYSFPRGP